MEHRLADLGILAAFWVAISFLAVLSLLVVRAGAAMYYWAKRRKGGM